MVITLYNNIHHYNHWQRKRVTNIQENQQRRIKKLNGKSMTA